MPDRKERVILDLDNRPYRRGLAQAAVETDAFSRHVDEAGQRGARSIDQLSGRLALFAKLGASIGPGAIPLLAAGTPAIAGLVTQMGFAVAGAGTMVLAFQGVGDALNAFQAYALDPTEANLDKIHDTMSQLSPTAQELVVTLREMGPQFRAIREEASEGLFPGLLDSLNDIEDLLPRVQDIVGTIARTTGDLTADSAESLAGDEWRDFFDYLQDEAQPTITKLWKTIGNLGKATAETWMAFDPLSDDFADGLLRASERLEESAENLESNEDFQEFLDYVQENGPQAVDTVVEIGDAFLQIVEAAAPLGGPVLQSLETMAEIVGTIADSPIGTPLIALVSTMSTLRLATDGYKRLTDSTFGTSAVAQLKAYGNSLLGVTSATDRARLSAAELAKVESQRRASIIKGTALIAGTAAIASGAAEKLELTNTATLGLVGTLGGPLGAAAGATVGYLLDIKSAGDEVDDTIRDLSRSLSANAADFGAQAGILTKFRDEYMALTADLEESQVDGSGLAHDIPAFFQTFDPDVISDVTDKLLGNATAQERLGEAWEDARDQAEGYRQGLDAVGEALGQDLIGPMTTNADAVDDLATIYESARPAMEALHITLDDLSEAWRRDVAARQEFVDAGGSPLAFTGELDALTGKIARYVTFADSAAGRSNAVRDALVALEGDIVPTTDAAEDLENALRAALDPKMNLGEARDAWHQMLSDLKDDLHSVQKETKDGIITVPGSREIFGQTEGARTNRDVFRGSINDITGYINAAAEAGAKTPELIALFERLRGRLLDSAEAQGINREELDKWLKRQGFVPELITTQFKQVGVKEAQRDLDRLEQTLQELTRPRTIRITKVQEQITGSDYGGTPDRLYAQGGWTGDEGGIVHRREFVVREGPAAAFRPWLEQINRLPGFAGGGWTGGESGPVVDVIDYDRLTAAMLRARPLYGPVSMQPHNYSEFQRQMAADSDMSMADGWG